MDVFIAQLVMMIVVDDKGPSIGMLAFSKLEAV